jgi:opacity protein-like surface antigen
MKKTYLFTLLLACGFAMQAVAQDSTQQKEEAPVPKSKFVKGTFQSSYLVNLPTVEMLRKGNLQFMIAHHFGMIWNKDADGGQNLAQFLGINSGIAKTYLSFDYSFTDWANAGLALAGASRYEGWVKFKILRQKTGEKSFPVTIAWVSLVNANALANPSDTVSANKLGWNKFSFMHQLLIARKFSSKFSLQVMPTLVHYNIVPYGINNSNNIFSIGLGAKYQLTTNKALTVEYARQLNVTDNVLDKFGNITNYTPDMFSIGLEFNTGGHIFQFYIGNATTSSNIEQLTRNTNQFALRNFALGFRMNRGFFIGSK